MTTVRRQQIAERIQRVLRRELGEQIDTRRMLDNARYARDVLLVCDAFPGTDLASLALHFRAESEAADGARRAGAPPVPVAKRQSKPAAAAPAQPGRWWTLKSLNAGR